MRKGKTICQLLGIKQEDLALLLNVSKGQLAMSETGKRDLPFTAMQKLAPMLQFMQEELLKAGSADMLKSQAEQKKQVLEELLKENKFQQYLLDKKIQVAEKKYASNQAKLQLMAYFEKEAIKNKTTNELKLVLDTKTITNLDKNWYAVVVKYQIKKELLEAEEKMLLRLLI